MDLYPDILCLVNDAETGDKEFDRHACQSSKHRTTRYSVKAAPRRRFRPFATAQIRHNTTFKQTQYIPTCIHIDTPWNTLNASFLSGLAIDGGVWIPLIFPRSSTITLRRREGPPRHYPRGLPARLDKNENLTLLDKLDEINNVRLNFKLNKEEEDGRTILEKTLTCRI